MHNAGMLGADRLLAGMELGCEILDQVAIGFGLHDPDGLVEVTHTARDRRRGAFPGLQPVNVTGKALLVDAIRRRLAWIK